MIYIKITTLFLTIAIFACQSKGNNTDIKTGQNGQGFTNDTTALENLTRALYKWKETKSSNVDFEPLQMRKNDVKYARLNVVDTNKDLKKLKKPICLPNILSPIITALH